MNTVTRDQNNKFLFLDQEDEYSHDEYFLDEYSRDEYFSSECFFDEMSTLSDFCDISPTSTSLTSTFFDFVRFILKEHSL